jgi:hypothetical protein
MKDLESIPLPAQTQSAPRRGRRQPAHGPVFVLAAPRSFSSIISTMIGQHPQLYSFPETHLFSVRKLGERASVKPAFRAGLLRAVAQLFWEEQTEKSVRRAQRWLNRRRGFPTARIFRMLARKVEPLIAVEKSPDLSAEMKSLGRVYRAFPDSRFLHVLRHPRGHGESVLKHFKEKRERRMAANHGAPARLADPQHGWYMRNMHIRRFLERVPPEQQAWVRGEDLLNNPDPWLRRIAAWLDLRTDDEAIEAMKHPERSPYAFFGPDNARGGNSASFLNDPVLRPECAKLESLDGPLKWQENGKGFCWDVRELARQFGYK